VTSGAKRDGFRAWVDRQASVDQPLLPLTHLSKAYVAENIIRSNEIAPADCEVFKEALAYFFYGRPAYRANKDGIVGSEAACPYCFLFSPSLLARAKRVFPFDTGAYHARLYKHVLIDEMELADFSLERNVPRINKLVHAAFGSAGNYFDGNRSCIPDPEVGAEAWEMAGRAYLQLLSSPGRNEPDDRICSIEVIFSDPVPLENNLLAVVVPHTHWRDGSGAPWLKELSNAGVVIIPFNFIPGRHPEYYQTMIEVAVKNYYVQKGCFGSPSA
jgi:hypothetical protein